MRRKNDYKYCSVVGQKSRVKSLDFSEMVSEVKWPLLMFICGIIENYCRAELKMIQVTMRHGDRYPSGKQYALMFYPNDPYFNNTSASDGPMQLTPVNTIELFYIKIRSSDFTMVTMIKFLIFRKEKSKRTTWVNFYMTDIKN